MFKQDSYLGTILCTDHDTKPLPGSFLFNSSSFHWYLSSYICSKQHETGHILNMWLRISLERYSNSSFTSSVSHITEGHNSTKLCYSVRKITIILVPINTCFTLYYNPTRSICNVCISTKNLFKGIQDFSTVLLKSLPASTHFLIPKSTLHFKLLLWQYPTSRYLIYFCSEILFPLVLVLFLVLVFLTTSGVYILMVNLVLS